MQRCLNDIFGGNCSGTPEISETEEVGSDKIGHWTLSKCKLSPKTCGNHIPFSEVVKPVKGLGSGVRMRTAGKEETVKSSSKKKKKEEPTFRQEALL